MAPVDLPPVLLGALKQHRSRQNEEKLQASHRRHSLLLQGAADPTGSEVFAEASPGREMYVLCTGRVSI